MNATITACAFCGAEFPTDVEARHHEGHACPFNLPSCGCEACRPKVTACPSWCELPEGHGWTDRGMNVLGDWIRAHERLLGDDVRVVQFEVATPAGGSVERLTVDIYSPQDGDQCMDAGEAYKVADALVARVLLRQAATLVERVEATA